MTRSYFILAFEQYWQYYQNGLFAHAFHKRFMKVKTIDGRLVFPIEGDEYVLHAAGACQEWPISASARIVVIRRRLVFAGGRPGNEWLQRAHGWTQVAQKIANSAFG